MSNARELLARLNPTTVRFDVGRGGGAPALTAQDIAAALAFVPAGLGRELLIACWWSDGSRRSRGLADAIGALVFAEYRERERGLSEARLDLGIAKACAGWHGPETAMQKAEVRRAEQVFEDAVAKRWPEQLPAMLPVLTKAVLDEMVRRPLCPVCQGRTAHEVDVPRCAECEGAGIKPASDRGRAEAIGRSHVAYQKTWAPVYEWLLSRCREAETVAERSLARAVERAA